MGEQIKISYFSFHFLAIQFFISTWEKSYEDIFYSSPHFSVITGNKDKIFPLPSFACFQHHVHASFSVFRYNSDLAKLECTILLFNFN